MAHRPTVAPAVGMAVCAIALSGCGDAPAPEARSSPSDYVDAVQDLLEPPSQLASVASERLGAAGADRSAPAPGASDLVRSARARLDRFRAMPLAHAGIRRQRDRLARAYAHLVPRMRNVADALEAGDHARLRVASAPFSSSLRSLPSAVAASSSSR